MNADGVEPGPRDDSRPRRSVLRALARPVAQRIGVRWSTVLMAVAFLGLGALYLHGHH